MKSTRRLYTLLAALLVVPGLSSCGGGSTESDTVPQLVASATFSTTPAALPIFEPVRARFFAVAGTGVIAFDPANGAQVVLIDSAADVPEWRTPGFPGWPTLSLSRSGRYLFIASSSGKLARFDFSTGQIDQRVDPPAGSPSNTRVVAVQASTTSDETVYALLQAGYGARATIATLEGNAWAPGRLDLGVEAGGSMTMKPDGTEILYSAGQSSRRIRIGAAGPEGVDNLNFGPEPHSNPPAPRYIRAGVLWVNRLLDPGTFTTVFTIPGASACAPLANQDHLVCIGERNFIYDLARRTVLSTWRREEFIHQFIAFGATGWVSEAGANRVAIEYQNATKGIIGRSAAIYTDPSLN